MLQRVTESCEDTSVILDAVIMVTIQSFKTANLFYFFIFFKLFNFKDKKIAKK